MEDRGSRPPAPDLCYAAFEKFEALVAEQIEAIANFDASASDGPPGLRVSRFWRGGKGGFLLETGRVDRPGRVDSGPR